MAGPEQMEFGLVFGGVDPGSAERAQRAEQLGFDYVATGEHLMFHGPTPNALMALAFAAAVTQRVKLLSSIVLLPLYPPAILAKQTAALDVLSGGRFQFGVGIGGEYPTEFEACGIPVNERGARANEALEVIRALWTGDTVDFAGRFTSFQAGRLQPPPTQRPGPPIWVSGRRDAAIRRAARYGDVWLPYMYSPEMVSTAGAKLATMCEDAGRPSDVVWNATFCFASVYPDGEKARRVASERVGGTYQQDFSKLGRYLVAGTPEECRRRIEEYRDAGSRAMILALACPPDEHDDMARVLAEDVLPALRGPVPT